MGGRYARRIGARRSRWATIPADYDMRIRAVRQGLGLSQASFAALWARAQGRRLSVGSAEALSLPRVLDEDRPAQGRRRRPPGREAPRCRATTLTDRSGSPAQRTVDDGLDRPFVGQGDDADGCLALANPVDAAGSLLDLHQCVAPIGDRTDAGYAVSGFVSWTSVSVLFSTCRRYSLRSVSILCHSPLASR